MSITTPWARVRNPTPIPDRLRSITQFSDDEFAELIRSNLMPRGTDKAGRQRWEHLWRFLQSNDDLAEQTYDVLEEFIDETDDALDRGDLDEAQTKRATKFIDQCDAAWNRLERRGSSRPSHRRMIMVLSRAIADHRRAIQDAGYSRPEDEELWSLLHRFKLDPS